jgi:hypothetical protein
MSKEMGKCEYERELLKEVLGVVERLVNLLILFLIRLVNFILLRSNNHWVLLSSRLIPA